MDRREFLGSVGAALAGLSLLGKTSDASSKHNLLVIMTDDQPYYTIPYTKTVAAQIRDQGTTFSPYAYVSTPICGPARATLLTGKWSHNTGLTSTAHPYAYQQLHNSPYESNTIADNGYLLGEHGLHKKDIPYEEASRTPFIVRGPNLPSGFESSVMVSHIDLAPTLLDLAGAPWSDLGGRSLVPVFLAGGARPEGWREEIFVRISDVGGTCSGRPNGPTWSGKMGRRNSMICTRIPSS